MTSVGEIADLAVRFGRQYRLKCVYCTHYVKEGATITCRCGAKYRQISGTEYLMERAGG